MMTIMVAPMIVVQILLLWYVILIAFGMMIAIWQITIERRIVAILMSAILLIICQLIYLPLRALEQYRDKGRSFAEWMERTYNTPFIAIVVVTVIITVLDVIVVRNSIKWRNSHISRTSVYESFQKLPIGICCYQDGGMTRLVNTKMSQIAIELIGSRISNGELFVSKLKEIAEGTGRVSLESNDELKNEEIKENTIVVKTKNGTVYSFSLTDIPFRNSVLHEILATDVTQEYNNLILLHKDKKRMQDINSRLRAYSKDIVDVNIEKEILDAKVKIHDELGHALIVSKRYLGNGDGDRNAILSLWRKNIALLKEERGESVSEDYETMFYIAKCAGVDIEVDGNLPFEYPAIKHIIVTAISECLTNVCRHTHGNLINIQVRDDDGKEIILIFTNNGDNPKEEIKEGGGLANLRKIVEGAGGTMQICSLPEYELRLVIPIGDIDNE